MRRNIQLSWFCAFCMLLSVFEGCKKADNFYTELQTLPQIDNSQNYLYQSAYVIGDTMVITGHLNPRNNLQITIGGVTANIVKTGTVKYNTSAADGSQVTGNMDQVSIVITQAMVGKQREVNVTSGGYSTTGAPIDVYTPGGEGSFSNPLKAVTVGTLSDNQSVMLYCRDGKGDIYYYTPAAKHIRHMKKDGTDELIYDLSQGLNIGVVEQVTTFLAGGVDPQNQNLYFSVQTNKGYRLLGLNLGTKVFQVLNRSANLSAPYEGDLGSVQIIVTGIYPDSKGNLYLAAGLGGIGNGFRIPNAIAYCPAVSHHIVYLYKGLVSGNTYQDMPGSIFGTGNISCYFSPDENLFYAVKSSSANSNTTIVVYDLSTKTQIYNLTVKPMSNNYQVISPFSGLQIDLGKGANFNNCFGFLPMPGYRLQSLLFQKIVSGINDVTAKNGMPKWTVFDFKGQRTYEYAPGRFDVANNSFTIRPVRDELLNTDEDGNLYMTANGKTSIVKTQTTN